jgi:hypothetical protein
LNIGLCVYRGTVIVGAVSQGRQADVTASAGWGEFAANCENNSQFRKNRPRFGCFGRRRGLIATRFQYVTDDTLLGRVAANFARRNSKASAPISELAANLLARTITPQWGVTRVADLSAHRKPTQ